VIELTGCFVGGSDHDLSRLGSNVAVYLPRDRIVPSEGKITMEGQKSGFASSLHWASILVPLDGA